MLLASALLGAADFPVDHVTVAGKDIQSMQARLATIGIQAEYGGPHSNHATEMALTSFPDGAYLELIAIQPNAYPKAVAAHVWAKLMEQNAGPCSWAVRSKDMGAEVARLKAAGVPVGELSHNGRQRPDGMRIEWEKAQIGKEPDGTFFPFLIRDLTPRKLRAFPSGKPTTRDFGGVARVVIAVRDLKDAVKRYREAYGLPEPIKQADPSFGAYMALVGGATVVLAAPLNAGSWLKARLEEFGEGPCAYVLSARRPGAYKPVSKTRWFGADISWFDAEKLGWHLGFEAQ